MLTILVPYLRGKVNNYLVSFLQNFAGSLFLFSGWVKAIDPLGTAYKMEQYFAEFESAFSGTWFSFLTPLFPRLAEASVGFAVFMIVFEMALGLMLITGLLRKFTAWAFFLLVAFFTVLTGFTYLTGYVPEGVNFFAFGQWGPYVETNMKVTDCGCFGDFIKLEPKVSFLKDVFLLIPALIFLSFHRQMHQLFNAGTRWVLTALAAGGFIVYCLSNYQWDLPHMDFRPFKEGVDIAEQKALEEEALANIEVIGYKLTHKETGETLELSFDDYMARFKEFPKENWEFEQIKTEPKIEPTKISDFSVENGQGEVMTEELLSQPGYTFLVVAHKLKGKRDGQEEILMRDTSYVVDTLRDGGVERMVKRQLVSNRTELVDHYTWSLDYVQRYTLRVNPVLEAAKADGHTVVAVTSLADNRKIESFRKNSQSDYPFLEADDILLKTFVRSNPGVVLLKKGKIVKKWHHSKLPAYEKIEAKYLQ
jgi:uncharacterized membrane protein YphA (DoxX/SURF4 family)